MEKGELPGKGAERQMGEPGSAGRQEPGEKNNPSRVVCPIQNGSKFHTEVYLPACDSGKAQACAWPQCQACGVRQQLFTSDF